MLFWRRVLWLCSRLAELRSRERRLREQERKLWEEVNSLPGSLRDYATQVLKGVTVDTKEATVDAIESELTAMFGDVASWTKEKCREVDEECWGAQRARANVYDRVRQARLAMAIRAIARTDVETAQQLLIALSVTKRLSYEDNVNRLPQAQGDFRRAYEQLCCGIENWQQESYR